MNLFLSMEKELREIIIPAEIISKVYPVVQIKEDNLKQIFTGKPIHKSDLITPLGVHQGGARTFSPSRSERRPQIVEYGGKKFEKEQIICVFSKDKFVGMYKVINGTDIFAKAEFVLQPI